jgi:hypothetical protein
MSFRSARWPTGPPGVGTTCTPSTPFNHVPIGLSAGGAR